MLLQRLINKFLPGFLATLLAPIAMAQAPIDYQAGDLLMGFRATAGDGAPKCYLVNIGQASTFTNASSPFVVTGLGNIKADLDATFTDWATDGNVFWSVSGAVGNFDPVGSDPAKTLYATKLQTTPGTPNTLRWTRNSSTTQGVVTSKMLSMADAFEFVNGDSIAGVKNQSTANSEKARVQNTTDVNSYASYQPGGTPANSGPSPGISFAQFNPTIEGTFTNGTAGSILELYRMTPGTAGTPGDFVGTFQLDDNANLTFTPFVDPSIANITIAQAAYTVNEADASGKVTITLNRGGNTANAVNVNVSTANGTANAGTNFTALTNFNVAFAATETSKTVDITIANEPGVQADKSFTVSLSGASAGASIKSPSSATVTITEGDATVAFSSATYQVADNAGNAVITLTRGGNLDVAFTVDFSTGDDTALAGSDFTGQTNTQVSFAANDTEKTVNVAITNRAGPQGSRTFDVTLSGASAGASIVTPGSAEVTITDGGVPGVFAFAAAVASFEQVKMDGMPNLLMIPINRTGGSDGTASVEVSVTGGTLVNGTDYNTFTNPTLVTFNDGETLKTVNIQLKALAPATTGTIILGLANPTAGATLGAQTSTTATVNTLDTKIPTLTVTSPKAGKLATGITTFNVTGTAGDDRGIDHVEVTINGVMQNATLGAFTGGQATFALNGVAAENGSNTITIVAVDPTGNRSKPQTRKVTFTNIRPALAGKYNGLLVPTGAASHNTSGLVSLTVKENGLFTGKVNLGAFSIAISGIVGNDNKLRFKPAFGTQLTLIGKANPPVTLGILDLTLATDEVSGNLTTDGVNAIAMLDGDRAFFDGRTPATTVPASLLNVSNSTKGFYTIVFPSEAQTPPVALTTYPQGDGGGTISLTSKGVLKFKGNLADGTPVSASVPLSKDFEAPLYAKLYKKLGSIAGLIIFNTALADSDLMGTDFLWFRPAITGKHYTAGWLDGITVDALGAKYSVPAGASVLPGLGATGQAAGNATLTFADGKLAAPVVKDLDVATNNKVTNLPAGDKTFSLKITAPKGAISGFFPHTDTTKTNYKGVILQKGANAGGYGYFLSNVPRGQTNGEAGGVSLTAK